MRVIALFLLFNSYSLFACMGPETEVAQMRDASTIFVGELQTYELAPKKTIAKLNFKVLSTTKGENKKSWTIVMRGRDLPKDQKSFLTKFGKKLEVGIRIFSGEQYESYHKSLEQGFGHLPFVVDAVCSMNGESWLLRSLK